MIMNNETRLTAWLEALGERDRLEAPAANAAWVPTPDCPPLPRFLGTATEFTPQERQHVEQCPYCLKMRALARREEERTPEKITGPSPPPGRQKSLSDLLKARSRALRNLTVLGSRGWPPTLPGQAVSDKRRQDFAADATPLLVSLLARASCVGVTFGGLVAEAIISVVDAWEAPPTRLSRAIDFVATVGEMVGVRSVRPNRSATILTRRLAAAINGHALDPDNEHLYTLQGVEAFISSCLDTKFFPDNMDEVELMRRRYATFENYSAIFGRSGVIHRLDALVTSCGTAHYKSPFWISELSKLGVSPEKLNSLVYGNIGGVLLEQKEGINGTDRALLVDLSRRWTGIQLSHIKDCAQREPGVILLAMRHNKAEVVLKCVEMDLVTELIIDQDLAGDLWKEVDPEGRYAHTVEVFKLPEERAATERLAQPPGEEVTP
jgi:DNA-binding transcriptional regulator LsrR (DeoR family)